MAMTTTAATSGSHGGRLARPALPPVFRDVGRLMVELTLVLGVTAREMSFLDHLEELRKRILWCLAFLAIALAGCWFFAEGLYEIASQPIRANPEVTLAIARPQDIFRLYMKVAFVAAVFLSSPFLILQAWMFIAPGLYPHERRYAVPFVLSASSLFLTGGAFGYFIAFPLTLRFLIDWITRAELAPIIDAIEYFGLLLNMLVGFGLVFQIPAVIFVLSRIGLVDARFLARHLKYAVLGSVVLGAVITPPDVTSMLAMAGPMFLLYAVGIPIAWIFGRSRRVTSDPH